ncbi:MAG TPA: hypothetical protein VGB81_02165, partial [Devosia sp.]
LTLMLELTGVTMPGPAQQNVVVSINGTELGTLAVTPDQTDRFTLAVPAEAIDAEGMANIELDLPDAINPNGRTANTHWRAVKLTAASLTPRS